jgi:hypothetical protein
MSDLIHHNNHSLFAGAPRLNGLDEPAYVDDTPAAKHLDEHLRMPHYLMTSLHRVKTWTLLQFGPNAPKSDKAVVKHVMEREIYHDPKDGMESRNYHDLCAIKYIMKIATAPLYYLRDIIALRSKSLFNPKLLEEKFDNLEARVEPPAPDVPGELRESGVFHYAAFRILDRWSDLRNLDCVPYDDVMIKEHAWAGIGYTGSRIANFTKSKIKAAGAEKGFIENGVDVNRFTPYATLCRIVSSPRPNTKHRPVCAESTHSLLVMGKPATAVYRAMLNTPHPSSFGTTLGDQSSVNTKLCASKSIWSEQVVLDFPSFDWGKTLEDGFHSCGVRAWEIRFAFTIISRMFNPSAANFVPLLFSLNYATFKRIAFRKSIYYFYELLASGLIWIFLLDSIICDLRYEMLSCSMGDPLSSRIVGGDDGIMLIAVAFSWMRANLILSPWHVRIGPPPKTQSATALGLLKFHGHYPQFGEPMRPEVEAMDCCILLERSDISEDQLELSCGRLKSIFYDTGRRHAWLEQAIHLMESDLGKEIAPKPLWYEDMWHAPSVLRSIVD